MGWKKRVKIYGGMTAAALLILSFVRPYRVSDISMNFSLIEGDIVWVENLTAGVHVPGFFFYMDRHLLKREEGIRRGDILAFRHPMDRHLYLKRCVALPGDRVMQRKKRFYLQIGADSRRTYRYGKLRGLPLEKIAGEWWLAEPYRRLYAVAHNPAVVGPKELIDYPATTVPAHRYFLMGDYRDNSTDSRFFGPVPYRYIYYRVFAVWQAIRDMESLTAISHIDSPETVQYH
jgi:signal peptidase I